MACSKYRRRCTITNRCTCYSYEKQCVSEYDDMLNGRFSNCKQITSRACAERIITIACDEFNCGNPDDCGNKYSPFLWTWYINHTVVTTENIVIGNKVNGLRVQSGKYRGSNHTPDESS